MLEVFEVIVIGAGDAGFKVAALAMDKQVALIYMPPFGGTCVNVGCVPSKFLIERSRIAATIRQSERFHMNVSGFTVDLPEIIRDKNLFVVSARQELLNDAQALKHVTLIEGQAQFVGAHEIKVANRMLYGDQIFIATGSRPKTPDIPGLNTVHALTSDSLLEMSQPPDHLLIVGGGYIACELGQTFRRFGSRVTVLETHSHLVAREEPEISEVLEGVFREEGITVLFSQKISEVRPNGNGIRLLSCANDEQPCIIDGSHLLMATGRMANTDSLNLIAAGLETDKDGAVKVDDQLQTRVPHIWAVGDVNNQQPFTRVCHEEARIAYANAFQNKTQRINRNILPHAIFTDPEVASVGLTEQQAVEAGYAVLVGKINYGQIARAQLAGKTTGLIKLIANRQDRTLLGCHIIGADAGNLIHTATLIMHQYGKIDLMADTIGVFPTLQEGMEAAAQSAK